MWEIQQQQRHYRSAGSSASESQSGLASQPGGAGASRASVGASSHGAGGILHPPGMPSTSEDLHAWSIYRQNLNVSINLFFLEVCVSNLVLQICSQTFNFTKISFESFKLDGPNGPT